MFNFVYSWRTCLSSAFVSFRSVTFPFLASDFCMSDGPPMLYILCSQQKPQLKRQQCNLLVKETSSLTHWEDGTACWLSSFNLFSFILFFWPRHLFFACTPLEFVFRGPPEYLIPSRGVKSFLKHTTFKQIVSVFTSLSCSIPLRRHDLIGSIANSGRTSFISMSLGVDLICPVFSLERILIP